MDITKRSEYALQQARELIENEWLAAGATREELEQDERMVKLLSELVKARQPLDNVLTEWEGKTPAEILRDYSVSTPALRSA